MEMDEDFLRDIPAEAHLKFLEFLDAERAEIAKLQTEIAKLKAERDAESIQRLFGDGLKGLEIVCRSTTISTHTSTHAAIERCEERDFYILEGIAENNLLKASAFLANSPGSRG